MRHRMHATGSHPPLAKHTYKLLTTATACLTVAIRRWAQLGQPKGRHLPHHQLPSR